MGEYKNRINAEVSRRVYQHQIDRAIAQFLDECVFKVFRRDELGDQFRCTIHIPDPVQDGYLYQLTNYHPDGGGAFRSFSERLGIIGKVWRSEKSRTVGTLLPNITATTSRDDQIAIITSEWGMSKREAERALKKPSYASFLLEHDGDKLGVFYMDSEKREAFKIDREGGKRTAMIDEELDPLRTSANTRISQKIRELLNGLADVSLRIDLQDTR